MDRRKFLLASSIVAGAGLVHGQIPLNSDLAIEPKVNLLKPKKISKGDTLGLIAPASSVRRASFEKSLANIEELGFKVKYSDNVRVRKGYLAGTDSQRIEDIHNMFSDPEVDGIICARGGYGCARLLSGIDYSLIQSNPKVLVGFSDVTSLLYAIHRYTGLVCFHGPVATSTFTPFTTSQFEKVLMKGKNKVVIKSPKSWNENENVVFDTVKISPGVVSGALVGGSLSLMVSLIGTPYDIDYTDKIVFIEEIKEPVYRIDRMLTQLLSAGKFDKIKGIAMGVFNKCDTDPEKDDFGVSASLKEVITDRLSNLEVPVLYGLPFGHIKDNATLPFGIEAELNVNKGSLTLLESAVL